jgi:RecB family exonuclease
LLSVKKLRQLREVYDLEILKDQETWVITPDPSSADLFRAGLVSSSLPALEVMTISSLISKLMEQISDCPGERRRKSELLPLLATIWKIKGQSLQFNSFLEIFNLFTELRSFSVQVHLFDDILEILPGQQGEVVKLFWDTLDEMKILDEHAEVSMLATLLKNDQSLKLPRGILFWGFNHFNGNQVDLIKSLSLWVDVEIPIHEKTYKEKKSTDYISWLETQVDNAEECEAKELKPRVDILHFGSGRLAETMKVFLENKRVSHIVLSDKKISHAMRMEIPVKNLLVKTDCDLFSGELNKLKDYVSEKVSSTDSQCSAVEIKKHSLLYKKKAIENKMAPNFRAYKVAELFESALEDYEQISVHNEVLTDFDIEVLIEIVSLNQPRAFSMPVGLMNFEKKLYSLAQLQEVPDGAEVVMCISGRYSPILRSTNSLSFEMAQKLSSVGPIQNPRLEFLTYKTEILDLFCRARLTVLIEAELEESDLGWKEILDECQLNSIAQKSYKKMIKSTPWTLINSTKDFKLSASRLQVYKECPRKYYHVYLEPFQVEIIKEHQLEARELGELEHKVVELAYKENIRAESTELLVFVQNHLDQLLKENNKKIGVHQYRIYQDEVYVLASNGLHFVERLSRLKDVISIEFELRLERLFPEKKVRGSVDLLVKTKRGLLIIDFKRSAGSIPASATALARFEKIQLWFYLSRLVSSVDEVIGLGYFNLSDPEQSLLICPEDNITLELNEIVSDINCKFSKSRIDLDQVLKDYQDFERVLATKLMTDKEFKIQPEDENSCTYCDVQMICPRQYLEGKR